MADWTLEIIKREVYEEDPDLSYLGEYTDCPWYEGINGNKLRDTARIIDRFPGDGEEDAYYRRESRYFVATDQLGETNPKTGKPWARSTRRKYALQQYERMERYTNDDWSMVGLYVEAVVTSASGERLFSTQSSGLWNVENDSGSDYYESVWADEMAEITETLTEINEVKLTPEQIADAIKYADYR